MGKVKWFIDLYDDDYRRRIIDAGDRWLIHDTVEWIEVEKKKRIVKK